MFNDELNDSPKNDAAGEARNLSRPANKINPTRSISSADSPRKPATTRAASGRDQREREGALRHAEEAWRNVLAARGISPGHKDFERGMARGMRIEADRHDNLTTRAGPRSRAKRDAA